MHTEHSGIYDDGSSEPRADRERRESAERFYFHKDAAIRARRERRHDEARYHEREEAREFRRRCEE